MNKKVIGAITGVALLMTSGGTAWMTVNQANALESGQASGQSIIQASNKVTSSTKSEGIVEAESNASGNASTNNDGSTSTNGSENTSSPASSVNIVNSQMTTFSDVKDSHWAKKSITAAVQKGYVTGYPGGIFKPDQAIKRDEFIKMVVQALEMDQQKQSVGKESGSAQDSVTESAGSAVVQSEASATSVGEPWYAPYVKSAQEDKLYLSSDFANNDKAWNTNITRKEMARIAVRAALGEEAKQDSKWMYLATKAGLITGLGKGELGESKTTTRAQSVTIIERILAVKNGEKLPVDKYAVGSAEIAWHGTNIFTVMPEIMVTDESQYKGKTIEELWQQDKMTITSRDGLYKGALDAVIAIDLEDPNDPNLKLLPPVDELNWFNNSGIIGGVPDEKNSVRKWKKSYVLYFKTSETFNKSKEKYTSSHNGPTYIMQGIDSPDVDKFFSGTLNESARLWHKKWGDTPAMIIPKTGWIQDRKIKIVINVPANAGYLYQEATVLELDGPRYKRD